MKSRLSFFLLAVGLVCLVAQSCDTANGLKANEDSYFVKYYGEDGDQTAVDMVLNDDGTIVILAKSNAGDKRIFLVKVDSRGSIRWQKKFGDATDEPKDIEITKDKSGYIILSEYQQSVSNKDIKLTVVSNDGIEVKTSTHGSLVDDHANSLTVLDDGGFIVAGYSNYDYTFSGRIETSFLHYRCDDDLVFMVNDWPEYSGSGADGHPPTKNFATKVIENGDNIYVFGYSNATSAQNPNDKMILVYYSIGDSGPDIQPNYFGDFNKNVQSAFVFKTPLELLDGFFMISTLDYETSSPRLRVSKLRNPLRANIVDDIQFDRTMNEDGFVSRNLTGIYATQSLTVPEGYLLVSNETDITGQTNVLLSKINQQGKEMWSVDYGSSKNDKAAAVIELPDGKILVLSTIQLDIQFKIALLKVNSKGQISN